MGAAPRGDPESARLLMTREGEAEYPVPYVPAGSGPPRSKAAKARRKRRWYRLRLVRAELVQHASGVTIALVWKFYLQGVEKRHGFHHIWMAISAMVGGAAAAVGLHAIPARFARRRRLLLTATAVADCARLTFVVFAAVTTLTWMLQHLNHHVSPTHANALAAAICFATCIPLVGVLACILPALPEEEEEAAHSQPSPRSSPRKASEYSMRLLEREQDERGLPGRRSAAVAAVRGAFALMNDENGTQVWVDSVVVVLLRFVVSALAVACAWAGEFALEKALDEWGGEDASDWSFALVTPAVLATIYAFQRVAGHRYASTTPHGRAVYREFLSLGMEVLPHLIAFAWFGLFLSLFGVYHGMSIFEDADPCKHHHNESGGSEAHGNLSGVAHIALRAARWLEGGELPGNESESGEHECDPDRNALIWFGSLMSLIIFPLTMHIINGQVERDRDEDVLCCGRGTPVDGLPHTMSWHHTVQHFFSHTLGLAMGFSWTAAIGTRLDWSSASLWRSQFPTVLITTASGCLLMAAAAWILLRTEKKLAAVEAAEAEAFEEIVNVAVASRAAQPPAGGGGGTADCACPAAQPPAAAFPEPPSAPEEPDQSPGMYGPQPTFYSIVDPIPGQSAPGDGEGADSVLVTTGSPPGPARPAGAAAPAAPPPPGAAPGAAHVDVAE